MNIYNNFRKTTPFQSHFKRGGDENFSKLYDEPTYLSFKLEFSPEYDLNRYNGVNTASSFNDMPHPLFDLSKKEGRYSGINYLNSINEPKRAVLLEKFINLFNIIQNDYQWYFSEINGLGDLLTINTARGSKTKKDTVINIKCLESLDRRMWHLFNLYRQIAWDSEYQRWILPDVMRFFTLNIYIADFRQFHRPFSKTTNNILENIGQNEFSKADNPGLLKSIGKDIINAGKDFISDTINAPFVDKNMDTVILKMMDNIIPVHLIKCKMCEFDISSFQTYDALNVNAGFNEQIFSFDIKVGTYSEIMTNPIFNTSFIDNIIINDTTRVKDVNDNKSINDFSKNKQYLKDIYTVASNTQSINKNHVSGTFYNENEGVYDNPATQSYTESWIKRNLYIKNNSVLGEWVNNSLDFGVNYSKNYIDDKLDAIKMHEFKPGISINSVQDAIAAQDIVGVIGLIRKGLENTRDGFSNEPSGNLDNIDDSFKEILKEYANMEVSADEKPIQNYVNLILSDEKEYDKMLNSEQMKILSGEDGLNKYSKFIEQKLIFDNNIKSATENDIIMFDGPSSLD